MKITRLVSLALVLVSQLTFAECVLSEAQAYSKADFTNDGIVDLADRAAGLNRIIAISSGVRASIEEMNKLDMNGDGKVNSVDYLAYAQHVQTFMTNQLTRRCQAAALRAYSIMDNENLVITNETFESVVNLIASAVDAQKRLPLANVGFDARLDFNRDGRYTSRDWLIADEAFRIR